VTTIATCGGYELIEDGPRLVFIDRGTNPYDIAMYVLVLLLAVLGFNGLLQGLLALGGEGSGVLSIVLLLAAGLVAAGLVAVMRARRLEKQKPPSVAHPILILDRHLGAVCDGWGRPVAPLEGAVVRPALQFGSSSQALEVACAVGTFVVARGSPFSGSIHDIADALRQRGIPVA
jgi:hypothetical protein